ncbi:MAG: 2-oxoacid:acceptor oxidoreductase family protein [Planctomycetes bacterium]|nr:2-oxoacid:acceptor oxidoreductase family protein [Planctomycetota bacterium]
MTRCGTSGAARDRFRADSPPRKEPLTEHHASPHPAPSPAAPRFPGLPATLDGSGMVVWVERHISEVACAYPITSSQTMGAGFQAEVANGHKNLWGQPLSFLEPESEHSAQSACEGVALAGTRVTNFTSGQGLILMKEVLYVISGKRLPMVLHIGARALTSHALNVHCGHDDVMGVADVGWGILFARNVQDVGDLTLVARRVTEQTGIPFMVVQDGFLTTHTIESCRLPEPELMKEFVGDPRERLENLFDPARPVMSGTVQNQDAYMKGKIAQREFYARVPKALHAAMADIEHLTGRPCGAIQTHQMADARHAIVAMGTMYETATTAVDYLRKARGSRIGAVHLTSFRPFPGPELVRALKGVKSLAVLERCDTPMGQSNPLTTEIKAAFADAACGHPDYPAITDVPAILSGAAGLGGRDVRLSDYIAVVENMTRADGHRYFSLGIDHPTAILPSERPVVRPAKAFSVRGHSVGGWGSITTNKVIATLMGNLFGLHVQAYPKYGSEKKGLPTNYFLIVAKEPIRIHHELEAVDFVAVHDPSALEGPNPFVGLRQGGWAFIQSMLHDPGEIAASLPPHIRKFLSERGATVLAADTVRIAEALAPRPEFQKRMQGIVLLGIFLRVMTHEEGHTRSPADLMKGVEEALRKYFGRRGDEVIKANLEAVKRGHDEVVFVSPEYLKVPGEAHACSTAH